MNAHELLAAGRCSPQCLLALGLEGSGCSCRCTGRYHAALADSEVPDHIRTSYPDSCPRCRIYPENWTPPEPYHVEVNKTQQVAYYRCPFCLEEWTCNWSLEWGRIIGYA